MPLSVAPSQEKAIAKVFRDFMNRRLDKREDKIKKVAGALITTVPSFENNASLNLLLYQASQFHIDVVIHRAEEFVFILHGRGKIEICDFDEIPTLPELQSKDTLYIFDPAGGSSNAVESIAYTVTASSKKQPHYNNLKNAMYQRALWVDSVYVEYEEFVSTYYSRETED